MTAIADVLELLTAQHLEIQLLFADLLATKPAAARVALFAVLADKVSSHLAAEEALFYPSVVDSTSPETMQEILAEHDAINDALTEMLWVAHGEDELQQKLAALGSLIEGHMKWQEDALFTRILAA